jgi:hypothetical protein
MAKVIGSVVVMSSNKGAYASATLLHLCETESGQKFFVQERKCTGKKSEFSGTGPENLSGEWVRTSGLEPETETLVSVYCSNFQFNLLRKRFEENQGNGVSFMTALLLD